jgi:hypothetical protein
MKSIRFLLAIAFGLCFTYSRAQLTAYINGKEVKSGAAVSQKDLASLQVSFKKPKDVTVISGASVLYVNLLDSKKESVQQWYIQKEGYVAINDFLKATPAQKKFKVFGEGDFPQRGNTLEWIMKEASGQEKQKTIQVKVGFYVVEETGYRTYGPQVQLLEPLVFNVAVWDSKNLFLPYLDLTIDKTNIAGDFDLKQSGRLGEKGTELGYGVKDSKFEFYNIYALSSDDHPGMTPAKLANDFIHEAVVVANMNSKVSFKDYDDQNYGLPWDDINGLKNSTTNLYRLASLSTRGNKELKKMDLMTLYKPVEVNGLKGYMFTDDVEVRNDINASKWRNAGKFVTYILAHPTNPKLSLIVSCRIYENKFTSIDEPDAFLKIIINSIKR